MTRAVILQPSYLPWIGAFDQMRLADVFVFLDDVQYTRRDWRNRNRVCDSTGAEVYLSVPVRTKGYFDAQIRDIQIDNAQPWQKKHVHTLHHLYSKTPGYTWAMEWLEPLLLQPWNLLADLCIATSRHIAQELGCNCEFLRSSDLDIANHGATERLATICQRLGANRYLTGPKAKNYLQESVFLEKGIEVEYHQFQHPIYKQGKHPFISHLSVVDYLCRVGEASVALLYPTGL